MKLSRWQRFSNLFEWLSRASGLVSREVSIICLFCMTLLITLDVIGRAFFEWTTLISDEVSRYLLIAVVFLGLSITQREGRHIHVEILDKWISRRRLAQLEAVVLTVSIIFITLFMWKTGLSAWLNYVQHSTSLTFLRTPMWIPYSLIPLGSALFTIVLVGELVKLLNFLFIRSSDNNETGYGS